MLFVARNVCILANGTVWYNVSGPSSAAFQRTRCCTIAACRGDKMMDMLINFEDMGWERPAPGVRQKVHTIGDRRMWLVEFSEGFTEQGWCTRGHVGYVLEGNMSVDFDGRIIDFKTGDRIDIPEGTENRHKAKIAMGERALLLLFEEM